MKKAIFKLLMAITIISFIAGSCKKESVLSGPEISFVNDTGYVWIDTAMASGDTAIIGLQCKWNGFDMIATINTYLNDEKFGNSYMVNNANGKELTFETKITRSLRTREKWDFEVIDSKGHVSRAGLTLSIDSGGNINFANALTGAQSYSFGSYYDFTDELNFVKADAESHQELIDLLGGYDFGEKTFFTSPGSSESLGVYDLSAWSTRNLTLFCSTTISPEQFDLVDKDNLLISSFHEDKAVEIIKGLKINQVYSFKTQAGKYGLLIIKKEAQSETGWINFDFKIQL
jgi:hypothetical protein